MKTPDFYKKIESLERDIKYYRQWDEDPSEVICAMLETVIEIFRIQQDTIARLLSEAQKDQP